MNAFNKDFFFILSTDNDRIPTLTADADTTAKEYDREVLPIGGKPLIFYNGSYEFQKEDHLVPISPPPEILFNGSNLVVVDRIAKKLWDLEIPNLAIQAAIYIDHKKKWHENYWFLTFTTRFDCWDRQHSTYYHKPSGTTPPQYEIYTYSFNEELLKKTPLSERRLFKMGGTTDGFVVAHESVVELFRVKWVDIVPIEDYGVKYP